MLITERKVLEKDIATSIIISTELMRKCEELKLLTTNRENEYYHIKQTNLAIAHIEKDFCCLTDYMVTTVSNPEELQSLPHMLVQFILLCIREEQNTGQVVIGLKTQQTI